MLVHTLFISYLLSLILHYLLPKHSRGQMTLNERPLRFILRTISKFLK